VRAKNPKTTHARNLQSAIFNFREFIMLPPYLEVG
jgi:hypothetical protein